MYVHTCVPYTVVVFHKLTLCVCVCVCVCVHLFPSLLQITSNSNSIFLNLIAALRLWAGPPTVVIRIGNKTATIALDGDAWQSHDRHCGLYAPSKGRLVITHNMA